MENPIILFDGVCNLCNDLVNFIIKLDKNKIFRFSLLQSEFSKNILNNSADELNQIKSIVLIENSRIFVKSDAVLLIAKHLGGFWKILEFFNFIPVPIRDFFYDLVAENRYRLFGKQKACMIPDENIRERFLS
ncbi:thiol-disulfide oxidoreductase DCC family protein [Bacteroidota bacterium]